MDVFPVFADLGGLLVTWGGSLPESIWTLFTGLVLLSISATFRSRRRELPSSQSADTAGEGLTKTAVPA